MPKKNQHTLVWIRNGSNINWIYQGNLEESMGLRLTFHEMGRIL